MRVLIFALLPLFVFLPKAGANEKGRNFNSYLKCLNHLSQALGTESSIEVEFTLHPNYKTDVFEYQDNVLTLVQNKGRRIEPIVLDEKFRIVPTLKKLDVLQRIIEEVVHHISDDYVNDFEHCDLPLLHMSNRQQSNRFYRVFRIVKPASETE